MGTEIKKIYNLEELNELPKNTFVNSYDLLLGRGKSTLYLDKEFDEEENTTKYSFLASHPEYPQDRTIISFDVWKGKIKFIEGMMKTAGHNHKFYRPMEAGHSEKSGLIWRIKSGGLK